LYNVHTPLQAKQEKIDKYKELSNPSSRHKNPKYAAMVEHTDEAVGKIINTLKEKGLYENTIILFSSDNGGLIGNPKRPVTNNSPLRTGKGDIYEGGVRIPTIIYSPKHNFKSKEISESIISMDYYPTLMDLAGISTEKTKEQTVDGKSLLPELNGVSSKQNDAIFWHYPHYHEQGGVPYSAVRWKEWKLIENFQTSTFELYNLKTDISESSNLIDENPEITEKLKLMLKDWRDDVDAQYTTPNKNFIKAKQRKKK